MDPHKCGDYVNALKEQIPLAEQGDLTTKFNLESMYPNYKTSVKWQSLPAEQGNAVAQDNIERLCCLDQGVTEDMVYAHMWINLAFPKMDLKGANILEAF